MTRLTEPPSCAVMWQVFARRKPHAWDGGFTIVDGLYFTGTVTARLWFDARARAMSLLGLGPDDVIVRPA